MADVIWTEDLERIAEELGVDHPDFERLQSFVSLVRTYPCDAASPDDYIRENLEDWIAAEEESFYGEHESTAKFAEFYFENYAEERIPNWLVVDWDATWECNLRHDFFFESNSTGGYVWAEVY